MGLFQKKSKQGRGGGVWEDTFLKSPLNFFLIYHWKLQTKQSSKPLDIPQNCVILDPLEIPKPKTKTLENSTFFLGAHHPFGNSTWFLINPWKFHMLFLWYPWKFRMLFLWYPWKFHTLDPPCRLDFFWNGPYFLSILFLLVKFLSAKWSI